MYHNKGNCKALLLLLSGLSSSVAFSGGQPPPQVTFHPVIALLGGYANVMNGGSHRYSGTDGEIFVYNNQNNGNNTGFIGAFVGAEYLLPQPGFSIQGGLEYDYFWPATVSGLNSVGIEASTATLYNYQYRIQTQQLLAVAKLLGTVHPIYHPYGSVGIGAAFNQSNQFSTSTAQLTNINITPVFNGNNQTAFTYNLGLGVEADIYQNLRVGLGYRFSGFGKSSLGSGKVVFNNYQYPVSFSLGNSNPYANQLLAQISYLA